MSDAVLAEKLAAISDRLARMEERQITATERIAALELRLADMERARWWMTGAATLIAAFAGWFAKTFHATSGGH